MARSAIRSVPFAMLWAALAAQASAQPARLANLSNLGTVGPGGSPLVSGFVVGPGAGATVLIRAVGPTLAAPASAGGFGVTGALADPVLALCSGGVPFAQSSGWSGADGAAMALAGAFPLLSGSKDDAIVASLAPGSYTAEVSSATGGSGIVLLEMYEVGPSAASSRLCNLSALAAVPAGGEANVGLALSGSTGNRTVLIRAVGPTLANFGVAGALVAPDLSLLDAAGGLLATNEVWETPVGFGAADAAAIASAAAQAGAFPLVPNSWDSAVIATVPPGSYTIEVRGVAGVGGLALVEAYDVTGAALPPTPPPTLFVAHLAPPPGVTGSSASGTATIYLAADGSSATINFSFTGLSSGEQAPHLTVGPPGGESNFVGISFPTGPITNAVWTFDAAGTFSSGEQYFDLLSNDIYLEIGSANYPTGELVGQFVRTPGEQVFSPPAEPPPIDLTQVGPADAARFLTQATFGPTLEDIGTVVSEGYAEWIAGQIALPATSHLAATRADAAAFPNSGPEPITADNRQAAWWKTAVTAPDQLRQRVAFALSEIFVVSDAASSLEDEPEALAAYYDLLAQDAFGNFRQLLEDVTLSPVMGNYLNLLRSSPADPAAGTSADENYARELMQLFTIGLNQLFPDGSLQLDANGLPIPTYGQAEVVETANLLTGWSYHSTLANPSFLGGEADWYDPMQPYPDYHDNSAKTIVGGVVVPANGGAAADLRILLDTLFNHPNTGPFICRQLIQRLVTSNPSPGYVYRVAEVFADDGTGTRGNLAAVIRAILLDDEARSPAAAAYSGFGKLKEPLLRQTALFRAFHAASADGRFPIFDSDQTLGQAALRAPTVFNFFSPGFMLPGPLAQAGLYAPEFEIATAATALNAANLLYAAIYPGAPDPSTPVLDLSPLTAAPDDSALLQSLNLLFGGGSLSPAALERISSALAALPSTTLPADRARFALDLAITAPGAAIQQ